MAVIFTEFTNVINTGEGQGELAMHAVVLNILHQQTSPYYTCQHVHSLVSGRGRGGGGRIKKKVMVFTQHASSAKPVTLEGGGGGGGGREHNKIFLILWDENVFHVWSLYRVQELCESRGGPPGLSVLMNLTVSMDVSNTELCLSTGHSLSLICQPTSEDMKLYIIIMIPLIINASNKGELCQCMSHCSCTSLKCGIRF